MLETLNACNTHLSKPILSIHDPAFASYGRVVTGYDFEPLLSYLYEHSEMPEAGNVYVASVAELESTLPAKQLQEVLYGGMPIQIGYCNGKNQTFNGMEYHKGSEVNIAATDMLLILGHTWDIKENTYQVEDAQVFFVQRGEAIEIYQTTLHLSPCRVSEEGFRTVVVLPRGTNTPLEKTSGQREPLDRLLLQKNKWVLAHPEREPLMKQGAYPGILGQNIELKY